VIPLPEIKVTDKTIPVLESLGVCLNSMIELQMQAYPSVWSSDERREEAEKHLFGRSPSGPAVAASPSNRFAFRPSGHPSVSQEIDNG